MIVELKSLMPVLEECFEECFSRFSDLPPADRTLMPDLQEERVLQMPDRGGGISSFEFAGFARERESFQIDRMPPDDSAAVREQGEGYFAPSFPGADENLLARLLEQLIQCSERNAVSTERIAEMLESGENNSFPVYS